MNRVRFRSAAGSSLLVALLWGCGGFGAGAGSPSGGSSLSIGVVIDGSSVSFSGESGLRVGGSGGPGFNVRAGTAVRVSAAGDRLNIERRGGSYRALGITSSGPIAVNGTRYHGTLRVSASGGAVTVVNVVPLEQYVAGVVGAELGRRSVQDMEALKAQAVASRTYALGNRGKWSARGFDLSGTTGDQVYGGADVESQEILRAVRATAGEVLMYGGRLIDVFYHSTGGYATATPEEAFETVTGRPYLQSVSDRVGDRYYCDISPHFRWTVEWDETQLRNILKRTLSEQLGIDPADVGRVDELIAYSTGPSGRLTELRIAVENGQIPVTGPRIRRVLEGPDGRPLRSNAVNFSSSSGGGATHFTAAGAGLGHGVGMCQWGAIGRARAGQSYDEILGHYFPGTRIEKRN